jgi:hypothetical protein
VLLSELEPEEVMQGGGHERGDAGTSTLNLQLQDPLHAPIGIEAAYVDAVMQQDEARLLELQKEQPLAPIVSCIFINSSLHAAAMLTAAGNVSVIHIGKDLAFQFKPKEEMTEDKCYLVQLVLDDEKYRVSVTTTQLTKLLHFEHMFTFTVINGLTLGHVKVLALGAMPSFYMTFEQDCLEFAKRFTIALHAAAFDDKSVMEKLLIRLKRISITQTSSEGTVRNDLSVAGDMRPARYAGAFSIKNLPALGITLIVLLLAVAVMNAIILWKMFSQRL